MSRDGAAPRPRTSRTPAWPLALVAALGGAAALSTARAQDPPSADQSLDDLVYDQFVDTKTGIDIDKMLTFWSQKLKTNIFVDPGLVGQKIKFISNDAPLTWGVFKKILDFYDIVIEEKDVKGHWVMFANLRRNAPVHIQPPYRLIPKDGALPQREEVVTAIVQVTHGAGPDIYQNLRGFLQRDQTRIANFLYVRGPEYIIIQDFASNVEYYTKIIRALDQPAPGQETRIYDVQVALAEDLARTLQSILKPTAGLGAQAQPVVPAPGGSSSSATPTITPDSRTNKLIVQALPYQFDEIERLIKTLDIKTPTRPMKLHLYRCRYTDASYLATMLSELFSGSGRGGGSGATGRKGAGGAGGASGAKGGGAAAGGSVSLGTPGQAAGGGTGKADFSTLETRIVPDVHANTLLIQAEQPVYEQILALLEGTKELGQGLDHPQRRVLIEGQIWEISTPQDNLTIGFELGAIQNPVKGQYRPSSITDFGLSTVNVDAAHQSISRVPNLSQGLTAVLTKDTFDKLPVIMSAVATLEHSRQISTPFALTNDNETASFKISENIPYPTTTLAGNGLSQSTASSIDVDTALEVTPQVNSDESLTLDVKIELGSVGAQGQAGLPPTTNKRSYNGTVTIPSMKYVVFGGLEGETNGEVETKVPWLGDIPILGHVFKNKQWTHSSTKIYIFLRATVFADDRPIDAFSRELRQKAHVAAERDQWLPPIVSERVVKSPWKRIQDDVFDVFGTGSGNPFAMPPRDE